jgi:ribonuclease BN (tRNA processing enzyme)
MRGHEKEAIYRLREYFEGEVIFAEDLMKLEM